MHSPSGHRGWGGYAAFIPGTGRDRLRRPAGDPRMQSLIAELSSARPRFREAWARADVGYGVGELQLYQNQLNVPHPNCEGQHVLIYRAEPHSDSARALRELRSLSPAPFGRATTPQGVPASNRYQRELPR